MADYIKASKVADAVSDGLNLDEVINNAIIEMGGVESAEFDTGEEFEALYAMNLIVSSIMAAAVNAMSTVYALAGMDEHVVQAFLNALPDTDRKAIASVLDIGYATWNDDAFAIMLDAIYSSEFGAIVNP